MVDCLQFDSFLFVRMKEQRLMKSSEGAPEILSWVNKSRKIEEKRNVEKEKAMQLSKNFEEQVAGTLCLFSFKISLIILLLCLMNDKSKILIRNLFAETGQHE